jgi:hypothetical protein
MNLSLVTCMIFSDLRILTWHPTGHGVACVSTRAEDPRELSDTSGYTKLPMA